MYIKTLALSQFRCFEDATLHLQVPDAAGGREQQNITVLLGVNGAGKSSLLHALVLGVASEALRDTGLLFRNLIRRGGEESTVAQLQAACVFLSQSDENLSGDGSIVTTIERGISAESPRLRQVDLPNIPASESLKYWDRALRRPRTAFLVGYGAQRRPSLGARFDLGRQDRRFHVRAQRVGSLFLEDMDLVPLSAWWPRSPVQDQVKQLLQKVLPADLLLLPSLDDAGELLVRFQGVDLPESALSDGYRSFLGWFGDLLFRLSEIQQPSEALWDVPGIVLVDEIDLHLHPAWQQNVIARISHALPKLQFLVTTHSPLIVGGVRRESLRVLQMNGRGTTRIASPDEETYGRTPDQILLSDTFGLREVRPQAFVEELARLRYRVKAGDVTAAVEYARMLALGEAGKVRP